jgi:hypothetical protein
MSARKHFPNLGKVEYDSSRPYVNPNGYAFDSFVLCPQCADPQYAPSEEWNGQQFFEDSPRFFDADGNEIDPEIIYPICDGESDSPCHCDACGALIYQGLTTDGVQYVRDYVRKHRNSLVGRQYRRVYDWIWS